MMLPRVLFTLSFLVVSAATLAGIALAGQAVTVGQSFPATPYQGQWPEPKPVLPGRIVVAVVAGTAGSVGTDLLAPYSVFARSEAFSVHVVAARREPVALTGGLTLLPDHTFDTMPPPDVVVVPAVAEPTGPVSAPLREFLVAQAARGARVLGVCAGVEVVAATGLLDGGEATSFWANLADLDNDYPKVKWLRGKRFVEHGRIVTTAGSPPGSRARCGWWSCSPVPVRLAAWPGRSPIRGPLWTSRRISPPPRICPTC